MKIVEIKDAEACTEGNIGYDFFLNKPIDCDFAEFLGKLGKYILYSDFDKPLFKVIVRGFYTLKGSFGNVSLRMLVPETISDEIINDFQKYVSSYVDK